MNLRKRRSDVVAAQPLEPYTMGKRRKVSKDGKEDKKSSREGAGAETGELNQKDTAPSVFALPHEADGQPDPKTSRKGKRSASVALDDVPLAKKSHIEVIFLFYLLNYLSEKAKIICFDSHTLPLNLYAT